MGETIEMKLNIMGTPRTLEGMCKAWRGDLTDGRIRLIHGIDFDKEDGELIDEKYRWYRRIYRDNETGKLYLLEFGGEFTQCGECTESGWIPGVSFCEITDLNAKWFMLESLQYNSNRRT